MIGRLRCALGRHEWLAVRWAPGSKRYVQRCRRCSVIRGRKGRPLGFYVPEPPRQQRRETERRERKDDAMMSRADRDLAELERSLG